MIFKNSFKVMINFIAVMLINPLFGYYEIDMINTKKISMSMSIILNPAFDFISFHGICNFL